MSSRPIGDEARQVRRQGVEDRRPPFGIARGGDEAARLVEQEQARALGRAEPLAVDPHVVGVAHVVGGAFEHLAVDADAAGGDPGSASRREHRPARAITLAMRLPSRTADFGLARRSCVVSHSLAAPAGLPGARACPKPEAARPPNEKRARSPSGEGVHDERPDEASDPMSVAFAEARAAEAARRGADRRGARSRRRGDRPRRQPHPRARRPDRARRNARHPRGRGRDRLASGWSAAISM